MEVQLRLSTFKYVLFTFKYVLLRLTKIKCDQLRNKPLKWAWLAKKNNNKHAQNISTASLGAEKLLSRKNSKAK